MMRTVSPADARSAPCWMVRTAVAGDVPSFASDPAGET